MLCFRAQSTLRKSRTWVSSMVLLDRVTEEARQDIESNSRVCEVEQDAVVTIADSWGLDRIDQVG